MQWLDTPANNTRTRFLIKFLAPQMLIKILTLPHFLIKILTLPQILLKIWTFHKLEMLHEKGGNFGCVQ